MNITFRQKSWRFKLPVVVGASYFLCSTPFLFNVLIPSIHEGNVYFFLFVLVNAPVIYLFGGRVDAVNHYLFVHPTPWTSNVVFIVISCMFWVSLAFLAGVIIDLKKNMGTSRIS